MRERQYNTCAKRNRGFRLTSCQANFASNRTRDRHVYLPLPMSHNFLFSLYQTNIQSFHFLDSYLSKRDMGNRTKHAIILDSGHRILHFTRVCVLILLSLSCILVLHVSWYVLLGQFVVLPNTWLWCKETNRAAVSMMNCNLFDMTSHENPLLIG